MIGVAETGETFVIVITKGANRVQISTISISVSIAIHLIAIAVEITILSSYAL